MLNMSVYGEPAEEKEGRACLDEAQSKLATSEGTTMVKHLPPAVKQLLALRNPHPFPSPPVHRLNAVLDVVRTEAKRHRAEDGWLVLSVRASHLV